MCGAGLAPTAFEADWIQECGRPRPLPYRIIGSRCCKSGRRRQSNHNMVVRRFCMGASNPSSCEEQCLLPLITFIMSTGAFVMAAWAAARTATRTKATARSPPARLRAKQSFVDRRYVCFNTDIALKMNWTCLALRWTTLWPCCPSFNNPPTVEMGTHRNP
jgi:hypothetical protein